MVDHPHSPLSMYCTMYNTQLHNPSFTASHAAVNREGRRTERESVSCFESSPLSEKVKSSE